MAVKNSISRVEKRQKKLKRKAMLKSILAIILALLLVGMAISPIFAESSVAWGVDQIVVSDYELNYTTAVAADEPVNEDYKAYIEFMTDTVMESYYKDASLRTLIDGAYKGLFSGLDPYSTYFTPAEYERFNTSLDGEFGGIGASVTEGKSGFVEVVAPIKNTPAEAAGLLPGDKIWKIDGVDATGFPTEKAVTLIRGEVGTKVTLTILREGHTEPLIFEITRALIRTKSVEFEVLEGGIGYLILSDFSDKTNAEFDAAMAQMKKSKLKKLILDVRNNPGGLLSVATYVSDYFVPFNEEIVTIDYKGEDDRVYRASRESLPFEVVVLVNKGSASASEILAGSIQRNQAGTIVGETTFGKGTVQTIMPLNNGGAVKLTFAEYKLKGNYQVNGVGIVPDVVVSSIRGLNDSTLAPITPASQNASLNVYAVQQRFNFIGYELPTDGVMGEDTKAAVAAFQKAKGLAVTGQLNKTTLEAFAKSFGDQIKGTEDPQLEKAIEILNKK